MTHNFINRRWNILLLLLMPAVTAHAQKMNPAIPNAEDKHLTRREYDTPGLVVELGARTAALDVLTFTKDGKHLLTAGDDKVVRTWDVMPQGLVASTTWPILRWPVFREARGNIYTAALSPDESLILIAGNDATNNGFGACIIDRKTGQPKAVSRKTPADSNFNAKEVVRTRSIWATAFAPSGRRVALGTETSAVWIWDFETETRPRLVAVHDGGVRRRDDHDKVRFLGFDGDNVLISMGGNGQILKTDLSNGTSMPLGQTKDPIATPVVRSADGASVAWVPEYASNEKNAGVIVAAFPSMTMKEYPLGNDLLAPGQAVLRYPHRVGLSADGRRIAVALRETDNYAVQKDIRFYRHLGGEVLLADLGMGNPVFRPGPKQSLYAEGVAFDPTNSNRLAIAGGDHFELSLWDTVAAAPVGPSITARDARTLWNCVLSPDANGRYVAFQSQRDPKATHPNRRGTGPWRVFDCETLTFNETGAFDADAVSQATVAAQESGQASDGWRVVTSVGTPNAMQWYLLPPGADQPVKLQWPDATDEFPRCYAFVTKGNRAAPQLLVGHYWGFSVYDCVVGKDDEQKPIIKRTRSFRGHEGYVTGISVSADGKRVVTCSRDMTLCGWALGTWQYHSQLGAEFLVRDGKLFVGRIAAGAPVWEMGMAEGDEVLAVASIDPTNDRKLNIVYNTGEDWTPEKMGQPDDVEKAPYAVGVQTMFTWKHAAGKARQNTTFIERPLWRMLPQGGDWVLWRWRDFQYACSSQGDASVGWQRSYRLEAGKAPDFYAAEQFRKAFQNPDKIKAMFAAWQNDAGTPEKFADLEPPKVTVTCANDIAAEGELAVSVQLTPRGAIENQAPARLLIWVNDYLFRDTLTDEPLPVAAKLGDAVTIEVRIPADKFRGGANTVFAQVYSRGAVRGDGTPVVVTSAKREVRPRLYGRFFGVGDYRLADMPSVRDLQAHVDARILAEAWTLQADKTFEAVDTLPLVDAEVTPKRVIAELQALAKVARPEDVVVVWLGGHGIRTKEVEQAMAAGKIPRQSLAGMKNFAFLTGDFRPGKFAETTLSIEEVQKALERINARKIVFLDTCRSGAAKATAEDPLANPLRVLAEHGVGCAIFAACKQDESAIEDPSKSYDSDSNAAGAFAIAICRFVKGKPSAIRMADGHPKSGGEKNDRVDVSEFHYGLVDQMKVVVAAIKDRDPARDSDKIKSITQVPDVFVPKTMERMLLVIP